MLDKPLSKDKFDGAAIANTDTPYTDLNALYADQANQVKGYGYKVTGIEGAFWYLGTTNAGSQDYDYVGVSSLNGVELIVRPNADGKTIPYIDGDAGSIPNISDYYKQHFTVDGSASLNYTLRAVSSLNNVIVNVLNISNFTLTITSENTNTEIWEKGVLSNSINILSNESVCIVNDGESWRVRNRY